MTATERLRALLDERGVEWEAPNNITRYIVTSWRVGAWEYGATETSGEEFSLQAEHNYWLTPEQAVEATLGRGTCHNKATQPRTFWCNRCDCAVEDWLDVGGKLGRINYCPNCGRTVVDA